MSTFGYNAQGYLSLLTDPLAHAAGLVHDAAGRATQVTRPDGEHMQFAYDANGNMVSITPPGGAAHAFDFTPADLRRAHDILDAVGAFLADARPQGY